MSRINPLRGLRRQLLPSRREGYSLFSPLNNHHRGVPLKKTISLSSSPIRYSSTSSVDWRGSDGSDSGTEENDATLSQLLPEYLKFAKEGDPSSQYALSMCLLMKYLSLTTDTSLQDSRTHDSLEASSDVSPPKEVKRSHFFKWVRQERERLKSENMEQSFNAEAEDEHHFLEEAVRFLQQSSDAGYHESTYLLGALLFEGYYKFESVEGRSKEDELKGLQLLWKAATGYTVPYSFLLSPTQDGVLSMLHANEQMIHEPREENPFALFDLATAYYSGSEFLGIESNSDVALSLYVRAANKNNDTDAMFWAGYIYWSLYSQKLQHVLKAPPPPTFLADGAGDVLSKEPADYEQYSEAFTIQSEEELEEEVRQVGELRERALDWLSKAASKSHSEALHFLGSVHFEAKDLENALKYMEKAGELGHQRALHILGDWYSQGKSLPPFLPADYRKALRYYDRASVATGYNNGENTEKVDQLRALSFINKGSMLMKGLGCKRDTRKAFESYQRAMQLGSAEACWRLYDMFRLGIGVPKNEERAKHYLNQAVALQKEMMDNKNLEMPTSSHHQILTPT